MYLLDAMIFRVDVNRDAGTFEEAGKYAPRLWGEALVNIHFSKSLMCCTPVRLRQMITR